MTGLEHLFLSIFQDLLFTVATMLSVWAVALSVGLPIIGTRAYRRKQEMEDQRQRVQIEILRAKEDAAVDSRLALTQHTDR